MGGEAPAEAARPHPQRRVFKIKIKSMPKYLHDRWPSRNSHITTRAQTNRETNSSDGNETRIERGRVRGAAQVGVVGERGRAEGRWQ